MENYLEKITLAISSGDLKGEIVNHPDVDATKSEDAARAAGLPLDCILKALLLVPEKEGAAIVAIISGNSKLDMKKFPKHRFARPGEVEKILGTEFGGIPPVFLPVPVILDKAVSEKALVAGSAGSKFAGIRLAPSEILRNNKTAKVVEISV
jgi:prolyl-tRNA editing enzyme YbaK/EbsC (Cys-tRNA(Pro) deacylase)